MPIDPNDSPGFLLWHVTLRWQRDIAAALAPLDLTPRAVRAAGHHLVAELPGRGFQPARPPQRPLNTPSAGRRLLTLCSPRYSLSAAEIPVSGQPKAPSAAVSRTKNQTAGFPLGSRPDLTAATIPNQQRRGVLTCENTRPYKTHQITRLLAKLKEAKDQIQRPEMASELRKRGAKGTRTPWPLACHEAPAQPLTSTNAA